jgi:two-component system sensor kinase FixL
VISLSGRTIQDGVEISVWDNGPGLSPEVMEHLFEPFVTTKASGMGLGLSISKTILEAHEGRLWAERAPLGGAVFRFTLPLALMDGKNE